MKDVHFSNPPLVELVLGLQCDELELFTIPHVGLLWQRFREQFPRTEVQHPLDPSFERFGHERLEARRPSIQLVQTPPFPRIWFLNLAGTELIQIQQDRFIHNWRKQEGDEYPHYDIVRERFRNELDLFGTFLADEGLGKVVPNQCEITYVNHILPGKLWQHHDEYDRVVNIGLGEALTSAGALEALRFRTTYLIRNSSNATIGRLYVSFQPGFSRTGGTPIFKLTLSARGAPEAASMESVFQFLDTAHALIVERFVSLTTRRAHEEWGI